MFTYVWLAVRKDFTGNIPKADTSASACITALSMKKLRSWLPISTVAGYEFCPFPIISALVFAF